MTSIIGDLIGNSLLFYNFASLAFMGSIFMFLGGLMIFADYYKRVHGRTAMGKIIGVEISERPKNAHMYYPIYRVKGSSGDTIEVKANWDSNMLINNLPGAQHKLFFSKQNPDTPEPNSIVLRIIGLVFFLPGVFITYESFSFIRFNLAYTAVFSVFCFYIFVRLSRAGWRDKFQKIKEEFKKARAEGRPLISSIEETDNNKRYPNGFKSRPMTNDEIVKTLSKEKKKCVTWSFALTLISGVMLFFAVWNVENTLELKRYGVETNAEIVDFVVSRDSDSTTYKAVYEFVAQNGQTVRKNDSFGSSHPTLSTGDIVKVLYNPYDVNKAMIDRGIWNFTLPAILASISFLFILLVIRMIRMLGWGVGMKPQRI